MLDGNIQIIADLGLFFDGLNQFFRDLLRVTVKDPNPLNPRYLGQFMQQQGQTLLPIPLQAVQGGLLGYQNQFLYSLFRQHIGLFQQNLHGYAAVAAPNLGNDAITAPLAASLRNLQIGIMASGSQYSVDAKFNRCIRILHKYRFAARQRLFHGIRDPADTSGAHDSIHLRNLCLNLSVIALSQTSCRHQRLDPAVLLQLCRLQQRIDTFLFGVSDKTAGIHHHNIALVFIICKTVSLLP